MLFRYRNDNRYAMFVENVKGDSVKLAPGEEWSSQAAVLSVKGLTLLSPIAKPKPKSTPEPKAPKKPKKTQEKKEEEV